MKKIVGLFAVLVAATVWAADIKPVDVSKFKEPIRVACVGDSITAGVSTFKGNSYPDQLGRMLGEKWDVKNFGVSGSTLLNKGDNPYQKAMGNWQPVPGKRGAKAVFFQKALEFLPDVVIIKLGTNDTRPQNWKFKDEFVADYKDMISQFAKLSSKPRFFLCHPAPVPNGRGKWGHNEKGILEELPLIDKVAQEEKADVIDIHSALLNHPELFPDNLHPADAGSTVMAKTVFKALTGKDYSGAEVALPVPKPVVKPAAKLVEKKAKK
jgi:acyl-CoA thioesterase I